MGVRVACLTRVVCIFGHLIQLPTKIFSESDPILTFGGKPTTSIAESDFIHTWAGNKSSILTVILHDIN